MALNEVLYQRLVQKFGHSNVEIKRPGVPYDPTWVSDPISGRKSRDFQTNGEAYRMNCPFCGDRKGRLYVNHFWMQWDSVVMRHADDMIKCLNDTRCFDADKAENRSRFFQYLFSGCNPKDVAMPIAAAAPGETKEVVPAPPGKIIPLSAMAPQQPICYYLRNRGYDLKVLNDYYGIGYVASVDRGHSSKCLDRIYIPLFCEHKLVGYQCRFIGDREWTDDVPKSIGMPNMKRGNYIYNYDIVRRSRVLVLVEGPTSAWRVGFRAGALWGNSLGGAQVTLINNTWSDDCLVVVLLDGKATTEAAKVTAKLQGNCHAKVVRVQLPVAEDPATFGEAPCWELIDRTCRERGLRLSDYLTGENNATTDVA